MGLFTKHSTTHFVRDDEGKVISTTKTGYEEKKTTWDRLANKRQENREARQKERQEHRYEAKYQKQQEHEAYRKARNEERIRLKAQQGRQSASHPVTSMLPPRRIVYVKSPDHKYYYKRNGKYYYHNEEKQQSHHQEQREQHHQITPEEFQKKLMKGFR